MNDNLDDATLSAIAKEATGDGVWIGPEFARTHQISAADEARIEAAVAGVDRADVVVVLAQEDTSGRFDGSFSRLSAWVNDDLPAEQQVVWLGTSHGELEAQVFFPNDSSDASWAAWLAQDDHEDVVDQVIGAADWIQQGDAYSAWSDREERGGWQQQTTPASSSGTEEGGFGWADAGVILTVGFVAVLLTWTFKTMLRRREQFRVDAKVVRSVRSAEDRSLRERADAEVLALGEALASSETKALSAAEVEVWQRALDSHEEAAERARAERPVADVIGALVLARQGEEARRAVTTPGVSVDEDWAPAPVCWFNPLHPAAIRRVRWKQKSGPVTVPACKACADAVSRGDEPADILDLLDGRETVHHFALDLGVWSRTGFGALEPDLLTALRATPN